MPRSPRSVLLPLLAVTASSAGCRSVPDRGAPTGRPSQIVAVADAGTDADADAGATTAAPASTASTYAIVATIGGRGRIFPLPDGDVVFTSRGYFFRLGEDGAIDLLGELDVERRGIDVANLVDAVVNVSGTAKALRVVTHHGHFRSGFVTKTHQLGPKGFTRARFSAYPMVARAGDALVAVDSGMYDDESPLDPHRTRGPLVVVSGKRPVPALPSPTFVVTSLAGTSDGRLFVIGRDNPDEGPLMQPPDTLLAWSADDAKPTVVSLPAPKTPDGDAPSSYATASRPVVLARSATDVWIAGPARRLLHGDPASLAPVSVPERCTEILGAWLGPGARLSLLCADPPASSNVDPAATRLATVFEHDERGRFAPVTLGDRAAATYASDLRSAFYTSSMLFPVGVERGKSVLGDAAVDGELHVTGGFTRGESDAWLVAVDRDSGRTLLLRKDANGPVRSLDHELAVRENQAPAPAATRACPGVLVSFGKSTPELFERVKKALAGEGTQTVLRGRVHEAEHVGVFVIGSSAGTSFDEATAVAKAARAKGLSPTLLCRRPVVSAAEDID